MMIGTRRLLDAIESFYDQTTAATSALLWSAWPTPDLSLRGWQLSDYPSMMVRLPRAEAQLAPTDLSIERVSNTASLLEFLDVVSRGFPFNDLAKSLTAWDERVLKEQSLHLWLGRVGGRAVSTSATIVGGDINGVTLIATLPEARGRGIGAAMTERAGSVVPEFPATLLASDKPRQLYEKLGYVAVTRFTLWERWLGSPIEA